MCDLALKHFITEKAFVNVNVVVCLQLRLDQGKTHLCLSWELFVKGGRGIGGISRQSDLNQ